MIFARVFWPLIVTAGLAACSGNLGGGQSTLPGAPPNGTNVQQIAQAAPSPTPVSASNVATLGDSVGPQPLPAVMGWSGTIAFPKPASSTPNPKATATSVAQPDAAVSVGVTASVVEPADAPHLGPASKKHAKRDAGAITPLLFVSLLATADLTLGEYPKIDFNVPRDIAAKHRDDTFALALFDPEKDKAYRLAVADRDMSSPAPGSMPSAPPTPVPTPVPTATPFGMPNGPAPFTPPPIGSALGSAALPPEFVAFKATATSLTLRANRPVVFALYAVPPQPSPSPSPSGSPRAAAAPSPGASAGASASPVPASSAGGSPLPVSSASPAASAKPVVTP